jgi:hypothetical protein
MADPIGAAQEETSRQLVAFAFALIAAPLAARALMRAMRQAADPDADRAERMRAHQWAETQWMRAARWCSAQADRARAAYEAERP